MEFFSSKIFKFILIGAAIVAIVGAFLYLINMVYKSGYSAGTTATEVKYKDALLDLQKKQTEQAQTLNDKIDKVLLFSQDAVTAVEVYTDQSKTFNSSVLATIKGKQLYLSTDCGKVSPDFQNAWESIRKGAQTK